MSDRLRLGYHGSRVLPTLIARSTGQAVDLVEYDVHDPFALLRAGAVDVMVTKFAQREPGLRYSGPVAVDPRAVLVALTHPLAERESVLVEDVARYGMFRNPGDMPAEVWDEVVPARTPAGTPLRREHDLTSVADLIALVAAGAAVHLTVLSMADILPASVRAIPVSDLPPASVQLAHLPGAPAPVRDFLTRCEAGMASWGFATSTGLAFTEAGIVDAHFAACEPTYRALLGRVGIRPGWHVLDAGCGGGMFLPWLADLVGPTGRVSAVDLAPENVAIARERSTALPCPVQPILGDLTALPYADNTFDAAWCANVVQYLDDGQLSGTLAELARVVRPGGLVAVKDLDAGTITARPANPALFTDFFRRAAADSAYARQLLRTRDLAGRLSGAGLADVRQHTELAEHHAPLTEAEWSFYGPACARIADQALALGLGGEWAAFADPDAPDHPLRSAGAYICEGNVLAVGTVVRT